MINATGSRTYYSDGGIRLAVNGESVIGYPDCSYCNGTGYYSISNERKQCFNCYSRTQVRETLLRNSKKIKDGFLRLELDVTRCGWKLDHDKITNHPRFRLWQEQIRIAEGLPKVTILKYEEF